MSGASRSIQPGKYVRAAIGIVTVFVAYMTIAFATSAIAKDVLKRAESPRPSAGAGDSEAAVKSGRDALQRTQHYPWYDPDSDSLKPAGFNRQPPPQTNSNNPQQPQQPKNLPPNKLSTKPPQSSGGSSSSSAAASTGFASTFMQGLMWLVLALVLCGLVYMLIQAYLNRENQSATESTELADKDTRTEAERVDALPFAVRRTKAGLLEEARRNYEAGNYREAIIYFYSHILVELDRAQIIRLERGKTNREYLREVTPRRSARDVLEPTMLRFEDVFFGDHPLPREQFEVCWQQLPRLEQLLQTASR